MQDVLCGGVGSSEGGGVGLVYLGYGRGGVVGGCLLGQGLRGLGCKLVTC